MLAVSLCFSAYILSYNPEPDNLTERIEHVEAEVQALRFELSVYKSEIWDRTRPFDHVIPISGGFLGIRKEE